MTAASPRAARKKGTALRITAVCLTALLCAAMYFGLILLERDDPSAGTEPETETAQKAPLQPGQYDGVQAVKAVVNFPLVALNEPCIARAENAVWQGRRAHLVTMTFSSGYVITAVSPREAAPLIRRGGLEISGNTDLTVIGMDAALAMGPAGACMYFSSGQAAYCLYGEGMTGEQVIVTGTGLTARNVY